MTSTTVSTDNGNSRTVIDTTEGAAAFLRRYGAQNVARELAGAGLPTEDYADDLAVLAALASAMPEGEIPTLP